MSLANSTIKNNSHKASWVTFDTIYPKQEKNVALEFIFPIIKQIIFQTKNNFLRIYMHIWRYLGGFWNFGHSPHFDEQLQTELACWLMESWDPIYADIDHPQQNQTSIRASDATPHLLRHLRESVSENIKL